MRGNERGTLVALLASPNFPATLFWIAGGALVAMAHDSSATSIGQTDLYGWSDISDAAIGASFGLGFGLLAGVMRLIVPGGLSGVSLAIAGGLWWLGAYSLNYAVGSLPFINSYLIGDALVFSVITAIPAWATSRFVAQSMAPWTLQIPVHFTAIRWRDVRLVLTVVMLAVLSVYLPLVAALATDVVRHGNELVVTFRQLDISEQWQHLFWLCTITFTTVAGLFALRLFDKVCDRYECGFTATASGLLVKDLRVGSDGEPVTDFSNVEMLYRSAIVGPDGKVKKSLSRRPITLQVNLAGDGFCAQRFRQGPLGMRAGAQRIVIEPYSRELAFEISCSGHRFGPGDRLVYLLEIVRVAASPPVVS